jgi:hypothetical protein
MRRARVAVLSVFAAALPGCGNGDLPELSGRWSGTMTDEAGERSFTGNCTQSGIRVRCAFEVTDAARGTTGPGVLTADIVTTGTSSTLSYIVSVPAPPCSIGVSGNAPIAGGVMDSTYGGTNSCAADTIRGGRLSLARQ